MTRLGRRKRLPHNARWDRRFRLSTVLFTFASLATAADWPQFRGPSASGVGSGAKPPIHWDAAKGTNVVWKAEIPGLAISSPIVWGDRVYLTTAISSDPTQKIRTGLYGDTDSANDRSSHQWKVKELWRTARAELPTRGTPAVVEGKGRTEVVTNGSKAIRGYDADTGKELWTLSPNSEVVCTTPVTGHGLIFVTAGYPPIQPIYAIKIGAAGNLYLASEDGDVFVVKAGAQYGLVAKNPIGEPVLATPAWADDMLIVRGAKHLFAIAEKP
jgi:hypothetical protein